MRGIGESGSASERARERVERNVWERGLEAWGPRAVVKASTRLERRLLLSSVNRCFGVHALLESSTGLEGRLVRSAQTGRVRD